ncbi:hypothetical protein [Aquimarina pacifica]|uniref:hypothetical protein n=1 Tax=Aquimarina pacifica TaxID=1296415 RepID=UPI0004705FCE|nr:hypothetical protein [Aquimarina pacifica]
MKTAKENLPIETTVIHNMMDRAVEIQKNCKEQCVDFNIMTSGSHPDTLLLRWTSIDISDPDRPLQYYRYECFYSDGRPQHCSIHYANQEEANRFFKGLSSVYTQEFAIDHKL